MAVDRDAQKLLRRAVSLHLKIGDLNSLTLAKYGPESHVSDLAESLTDLNEQLMEAFYKLVKASKEGRELSA